MKKILLFLLACLFFVLTACNSRGNNSQVDNSRDNESCSPNGHNLTCVASIENHVYRCTRSGCEYEKEPMPHHFEASGEPCSDCGIDYETVNLEFTLAKNGKSYIVSGIGNCKDIKEIKIPGIYNGLPVTEIGNEAFCTPKLLFGSNDTVESIIIPDSVTKIGDKAFQHRTNLRTVKLPQALTHIGDYAFAGTAIESIRIPSTVAFIGKSAFMDCIKLSQVNIPEGITELNGTFAYCSALESITLPQSLKVLNGGFEYTGLKSITIPDSVELIDYAFCNTQLETVVIGGGIKNVRLLNCAFADCYKLRKVIIKENVEKIGDAVFWSCTELTDVIIEGEVKEIGLEAFENCTKLTNITIPDSIEFIEYNAFNNCPSIAYNVYEGMNYLGNEEKPYLVLCSSAGGDKLVAHSDTKLFKSKALLNEENITEICIGPNVEHINFLALGGMDGVTKITVDANNKKFHAAGTCLIETDAKSLVQAFVCSEIPSDGSVAFIDTMAFSYLGTLETMYIPKGVTELHINFDACTSLKYVIIESDVTKILCHGNARNGDFNVFFCHNSEEWENVDMSKTYKEGGIRPVDNFNDKAVHYLYSETEPAKSGNFWHYVDGEIVIWE